MAMRRRSVLSFALLVLLMILAGCEEDSSTPLTPTGDKDGSLPAGPELSNDLRSNLFDWPAREFGPGNYATISIFKRAGDRAVDFTLRDLEGNSYRLSDLLTTRPVLLEMGSYT